MLGDLGFQPREPPGEFRSPAGLSTRLPSLLVILSAEEGAEKRRAWPPGAPDTGSWTRKARVAGSGLGSAPSERRPGRGEEEGGLATLAALPRVHVWGGGGAGRSP